LSNAFHGVLSTLEARALTDPDDWFEVHWRGRLFNEGAKKDEATFATS